MYNIFVIFLIFLVGFFIGCYYIAKYFETEKENDKKNIQQIEKNTKTELLKLYSKRLKED